MTKSDDCAERKAIRIAKQREIELLKRTGLTTVQIARQLKMPVVSVRALLMNRSVLEDAD